jgi:hypothetical protein
MVADEPSNAELAWRLEAIQRELVSRSEYAARLEAAEHRFADLGGDVSRLDRRHDEDMVRVHQRLDDHEKAHAANGMSWRQIIWPMLGAFVASAAAIAVQLVTSGGH